MTPRRLLVIGGFGPGQLPDSYARAFERVGWEVFCLNSDRAYFEASRFAANRFFRRAARSILWDKINRATITVVHTVKPHAVMAVKASYLNAETVRTIRREMGIPFFNYYPDNPYCGVPLNPRKTSAQRRDLIDVLREYTRVWTWEPGLTRRLNDDRVAAAYLPFGVDDDVFSQSAQVGVDPCAECDAAHSIVFVGQHSDKRAAHLAAVRAHPVSLWGGRWSRAAKLFGGRHRIHTRTAFGADCAALYRGADVSLNVVDDLNMPGHNMRTFEIPGSGGVMVSSHTAEQAAIFPEGEAAFYYRRPEELDGIIGRIRDDAALAARVRSRAAAIATDHTYVRRAEAMLAELELS